MNVVLLGILYVVALGITIWRGPGATFIYVMLPGLLLLSQVPAVSIEPLPDFVTGSSISYAAMMGTILRGRVPKLKLHPIDYIVMVCTGSIVVTAYSTGIFWTMVSALGDQVLNWLVPYFMARLAFQDATLRRHGAYITSACAMLLGFFALVEFRLNPYIYARTLKLVGLSMAQSEGVLARNGFFRAQTSFAHPIDLGNSSLVIGGLVLVFAYSSRLTWRNWIITGGFLASGAMLLGSFSFSSILGAIVAGGLFLALRYARSSGFLLPVVVAVIAVGLVYMTNKLMGVDTSVHRVYTGQSNVEDSYWIRALIVQNAMPFVKTAGFFGWGNTIGKNELNLDSVDNSYLLFIIRRGWVYIVLWFVLIMTIAVTGYRTLKHQKSVAARVPVAAAISVLFGTLIAMYTVWFGFVYAMLWTLLLGMTTTMSQMLSGRILPVAEVARERHGFPVFPQRRRPVPVAELVGHKAHG